MYLEFIAERIVLRLLDIDKTDNSSLVLLGKLTEDGFEHFARRTPGGGEDKNN